MSPYLRPVFCAVLILALQVGFALRGWASNGPLPGGSKTIALVTASGERLKIGTAVFNTDGAARDFSVVIEAPDLQVEFLSMRNFQCLRGEKETWCHIPYPYETKSRITPGDLIDLEYALMFLFKPPASFGIDTWNGLYFKLSLDDAGVISGQVHDIDLGPLGVPPSDVSARPISHGDVTKPAAGTHRFERLEIR